MVAGCVTPVRVNIGKQTFLLFLLWVRRLDPDTGWSLALLAELDVWLVSGHPRADGFVWGLWTTKGEREHREH